LVASAAATGGALNAVRSTIPRKQRNRDSDRPYIAACHAQVRIVDSTIIDIGDIFAIVQNVAGPHHHYDRLLAARREFELRRGRQKLGRNVPCGSASARKIAEIELDRAFAPPFIFDADGHNTRLAESGIDDQIRVRNAAVAVTGIGLPAATILRLFAG
jgi:hypothetical protein